MPRLYAILVLSVIVFSLYPSNSLHIARLNRPSSLILSSSLIGGDDMSKDGGEDVFGAAIGPLPSVSSKINYPEEKVNIKTDLYVVGAGTLGSIAAQKWKELFPSSKIIAETRTTSRHSDFAAYGIEARTREQRLQPADAAQCERSAKNVLICFPPSSTGGTQDLFAELAEACRLWAGPQGGGTLLYTSSTAVYGDSHGNTVTETFRVDTRSARSTRSIGAEEQIVTRGGSVIRLAGLYSASRGPHTYWLKSGSVDGNEDGRLNMLHYEDAAAACVSALQARVSGTNIDPSMYSNSNKETLSLSGQNVFLACDDAPITRIEVCRSALASKLFPDSALPSFSSKEGPPGKLCDSSWTREKLGWRPVYPSFRGYMRALGGENVVEETPAVEKKSVLWLPGDDDDL